MGGRIIALRRSHDHSFEAFIEHEGERSGRRTVSVDPERLNDHLEGESFRRWEESENNEDSWYER